MDITKTKCYNCPDKLLHASDWYCRFNPSQNIMLKEEQEVPEWCRRLIKLDSPHWGDAEVVNYPHHMSHYVYIGKKNFLYDIWLMNDYSDPRKIFGIWGIEYIDKDKKYIGFEYHDNYEDKYYLSCDYVDSYLRKTINE